MDEKRAFVEKPGKTNTMRAKPPLHRPTPAGLNKLIRGMDAKLERAERLMAKIELKLAQK